jgi:PAS domain S-box-containing protein
LRSVAGRIWRKAAQIRGSLVARRTTVTKAQLRREIRRQTDARIRAERSLDEIRSRFQSIFDNATDVIIYVGVTGKLLDVNAKVEQVFGYRPDEIIGKHFIRLGVLRVRDIFRTVKLFRRTIRERKADPFVELELKHKNGDSVFVEVGSQFIVRDGKVKGVVSIFRDITERRRVLNELIAARTDAEAANRTKSEFLANMSHEIRTPMTAILGFADVLSSKVSDPDGQDAIHTIQRNGGYLLSILDDILDLSKIEAGKLQVERRPCSPLQIVADVLSLMRIRAEAKNLTLSAEYCGPIPEVIHSDPTRLRQILINLISNAVKFSDFGNIRLAVRLVRTPGLPPKLRFDVVDSGIGMTEEQLHGLFQPFAQVHEPEAIGRGGTGLGLAITKRLVEMLGGAVSAQSAAGVGSTFTVAIDTGPLDGVRISDHAVEAAAATGAPATASPGVQVRLDCRVLLAEDGPDNQKLIAFLLRKSGAEVEVVENGRLAVDAALAAADAGRAFDAILMDMHMPVMDGYLATQRLRSLGYRGSIIALTAHAMKDDRQKCLDAGCDQYLAKPIDRANLLAAVAEEVSRVDAISHQDCVV